MLLVNSYLKPKSHATLACHHQEPFFFSQQLSQEAHNGSKRGLGSSQGSAPELPADSKFILDTPSPDILTNGVIYDKYLSNEGKILAAINAIKPALFVNNKNVLIVNEHSRPDVFKNVG